MTDLFDNSIEKMIDDAFKPDEKERLVGDKDFDYFYKKYHNEYHHGYFHTHTHTPSSYSHTINDRGYMRNEVYDELIFGHLRHRHDYVHRERSILCQRCGSEHELLVKERRSESFLTATEARVPYNMSIEVSNFFCPVCGERYRYYGKILKVATEVKQYDN